MLIAAVLIVLATFMPQSNEASRRRLKKFKLAALALLLKG